MAVRAHQVGREVELEGGGSTWYVDREELQELALDLVLGLYRNGGMLNVVAHRVEVGVLAGKPLMETQRVSFFYETAVPLESKAEPAPVEDDEDDDEDEETPA